MNDACSIIQVPGYCYSYLILSHVAGPLRVDIDPVIGLLIGRFVSTSREPFLHYNIACERRLRDGKYLLMSLSTLHPNLKSSRHLEPV